MQKKLLIFVLSISFITTIIAQNIEINKEYFLSIGETESFEYVNRSKEIKHCELYLETFLESKYKDDVTKIYDKAFYIEAYDVATTKFEVDSLQLYLQKFPNGKYQRKAEMAVDIISWQKAKAENTPESIKAYLEKFPNGRAAKIAQKELEKF
ncbi:MAG: hypothetical protein ABFR62_08855 [Bacteroidota bacterium]